MAAASGNGSLASHRRTCVLRWCTGLIEYDPCTCIAIKKECSEGHRPSPFTPISNSACLVHCTLSVRSVGAQDWASNRALEGGIFTGGGHGCYGNVCGCISASSNVGGEVSEREVLISFLILQYLWLFRQTGAIRCKYLPNGGIHWLVLQHWMPQLSNEHQIALAHLHGHWNDEQSRWRPRCIFLFILFAAWFTAPNKKMTHPHMLHPGHISFKMPPPPPPLPLMFG